METINLSTLRIHKLSKEQYDRELEAGAIDETAIYLTPEEEATQSTSGLMSSADKTQLDYGGVPIVTASSSDGAVYTVATDNITALTTGMRLTIIPDKVSGSSAPRLNVNNLGEKTIRCRLSNSTGSTAAPASATFLTANKPTTVMFDGIYWIVTDNPRPNLAAAYGTNEVSHGGTGVASLTSGSFLVGNGTEAMVEKTPTEVLEHIGAKAKSTISVDATSGDKSIALTLSNSSYKWRYVYGSGITSLTLSISEEFSNDTEAEYSVLFCSGNTATTINDNLGIYFTGDDCTSGTFTPSTSKTYEVSIWWNGLSWQASVRGT